MALVGFGIEFAIYTIHISLIFFSTRNALNIRNREQITLCDIFIDKVMSFLPAATLPTLTEPGVRYFLSGTLKECKKFRENYINGIFNASMTGLFLVLVGFFLLYKYRGKLTAAEQAIKTRKKQEYILGKLQLLKEQRRINSQNTITNLPGW